MITFIFFWFMLAFIYGMITHREEHELLYGRDMYRGGYTDAQRAIQQSIWMNLDE